MKQKLLLTLVALFSVLGGWANDYQPADGQFIKLHHANTDANWYIGMNELGTTEQKYNQAQTNGIDVWKVVATSSVGQFYLFNPYCGKYLGKTGSVSDNQNIPMVNATGDAGQYQFIAGESTIGSKEYDAFYLRDVTNSNNSRNGLHSTSAVTFVRWESQNNCENSLWLPEEVEDPETTLLNNYKTLASSFKTMCNGHTNNVGQTFYMRNEVKTLLDAIGNDEPTTYNANNFLGIKTNQNNLVVVPEVGTIWYVESYHATNNVTRYLALNSDNTLEVNDTKDIHAVWKVIASDQTNGTIQLQSVYNPTYYLNQAGGTLGAYTNGAVNIYLGRKFAQAQDCVNMCVSSGDYKNTTSTETNSSFGFCSNEGMMDAQGGHSTNWKFEVCNEVQTVVYTFPGVDGGTFDAHIELYNGADASASIPTVNFFNATGLAQGTTTVSETNKTFTVQGDWNFPIPFNRVMRLHGHAGSKWLVYNSDSKADYINTADGFRKDCYWYFTYAGMTASNKVMVYLHTLVNDKKVTLANTNNSTQASFGNGTPLVYITNGNGFSLAHNENLNDCLNNFAGAGILKTWNDDSSPADNGSRFNIKIDQFDQDLANVTVIAGVEDSKFLGEAPFPVNITKKQTAISNPTSENVKAVFTPEINENKYYRLHCQATNRSHNYIYSDIHANTNGVVDDAAAAHRLIVSKNEAAVVNTLFKFEKDNENDRYYVQHVNSGKYLSGATDGVDLPFNKNSASTYEPAQVEGKWWGLKKTGTNIHLHQSNQSDGKLLVWGAFNAEAASNWCIEEVTEIPVTIDEDGYSTFCFPVKVEKPEGVEVYLVNTKDETHVQLAQYNGDIIPAGTGVVLKNEGTHNFTITASAVDGDVSANILAGATIRRQGFEANANYVLANKSNGIGFYMSGTITAIPANKAYLPVANISAGASMLTFDFDDEIETAIKELEAEKLANSTIYDIQGRLVKNPTKGLYIVNGKKVMFK